MAVEQGEKTGGGGGDVGFLRGMGVMSLLKWGVIQKGSVSRNIVVNGWCECSGVTSIGRWTVGV